MPDRAPEGERRAMPLRIVMPMVAGIGNALMAEPLVRAVKAQMADATIIIAARQTAIGDVFQHHPDVDEVRVLGSSSMAVARAFRRLASPRPDVFLVPFPSNRWEYYAAARFTRARRIVMHRYPVGRLTALGAFPADRVDAVKGIHDVEQNLSLLPLLGLKAVAATSPVMHVSAIERGAADNLWQEAGLDAAARPVLIHPGCANTRIGRAKRWPAERYGELIDTLFARGMGPFLVIEGPDERGVARDVASRTNADCHVIAFSSTVGTTAAVVDRCRLYVGSDSGVAHLAAAMSVPPVTLFAPADPSRVAPFGYRELVVQPRGKDCSPCLRYPMASTRPVPLCKPPLCVEAITIDDVIAAVERAVAIAADATRSPGTNCE